jgi:hypothetical protein
MHEFSPIRISACTSARRTRRSTWCAKGSFNCTLRAGELTVDSALIRRRLATLERGTFASPAYITRFGMPASVDALEADGHRMVGRYAPEKVPVSARSCRRRIRERCCGRGRVL